MDARLHRLPLLAIGLTVIGSVGTWYTLGPLKFGGLDRDGSVSLGFAIFAAVWVILGMVRKRRPSRIALGLSAAIIVLIGIIDLGDINDKGADPAWGIYLTLAGGILLLLATVVNVMTKMPSEPAV